MMRKMIKLIMGLIMLASITGAYASNTGVIKVTNKCAKQYVFTVLPGASDKAPFDPDNPCPTTVSFPQIVRIGQSAEVPYLSTRCNYNVVGISSSLIAVNFNTTKTSHAEIVFDKSDEDGLCKPHLELK